MLRVEQFRLARVAAEKFGASNHSAFFDDSPRVDERGTGVRRRAHFEFGVGKTRDRFHPAHEVVPERRDVSARRGTGPTCQ